MTTPSPQPPNAVSPTTPPVRGLGDAIHTLTSAMGISACTGCERRREFFNRMLRWSTESDPLKAYIISQENRTNET
jgi:hypothetical protein